MRRHERNFYGKAWTVEWVGPVAYVTDAHSASTVAVTMTAGRVSGSEARLWAAVPPYLRRILRRRMATIERHRSERCHLRRIKRES